MDYRCPICGADLGRRKLTQAIVARMDIECSGCKGDIRLNVHWVEEIVVLLGFGTAVALAALAYWSQNQGLVIAAAGAALLGSLALPVLEKTFLRAWPRYVPRVQ
jgi:DNA-directed RNA polymerase subunit RPC12/RpoP